ncbi:hypothetical protein HU200_001504 [Digitaria exilis]|uniref:F-box domain-containing protein n=1 Tax=Digitaria exilis TaxID=1010633 RepID=A0A835FZL9_9POAL|nr:hypothetical protein HU200_001504 [Digitaria exilis]
MEMEVDDAGARWDFLDWVGPDTSACIFHLLDDPTDLARAAAVSRSWRRFVIHSGFCKRLCHQICPEVATFTRAVVVTRSPPASESSRHAEARDHLVYSNLGGALASANPSMDCIIRSIGASTTDNFPEETIDNTREPRDRVNHRPSYWSSGGHDDPDVPESLIYKLSSDLCIIDELRIQPFQESFVTLANENQRAVADENYTWMYTSPEFPMMQENVLQTFKLPRPVLCIGGVAKIELLGRVQKQATDDRYYICVCHAQVMGRSLSPEFMVDISDPAGYSTLKYLPGASNLRVEDILNGDTKDSTEWHSLVARYRQIRHMAMVNMLLGPVHFMDDDDDDAGGVTDDDMYM